MADASGMISSLAYDQAPNQDQSALDVFLQIYPRSPAEFLSAVGPQERAEVPYPPAISRRAGDAISCATMGGTWDSTRGTCIPPVTPLPPPVFPGGGSGSSPQDRAQQCIQECASVTDPSQKSICLANCQGGGIGATPGIPGGGGGIGGLNLGGLLGGLGGDVVKIGIVIIGIILILVALALIVK